MEDEEEQGGRIFFSSTGRSLEVEDEIRLLSVGIDIGSATSHLAFSRIVLERLDSRYIVVERSLIHQSEVMLTPYREGEDIDEEVVGAFINAQYRLAGVNPDEVDTGALILTGVAVRRRNARAIGGVLAGDAGKFVVLTAGDALETTLAAFGSGAVALSARSDRPILNLDIGGGTAKLALCIGGSIRHITAVDVGARVIAFDADRRVTRIEPAGRHFAALAGAEIDIGGTFPAEAAGRVASAMVDVLLEAAEGRQPSAERKKLYRLPPLPGVLSPPSLVVCGGVGEYFNGGEARSFGDLGADIADHLRDRLSRRPDVVVVPAVESIRATVVGASQYAVQVSGSTIYLSPMSLLPLRNVPVIAPDLPLSEEEIEGAAIEAAIRTALTNRDLAESETAVALFYRWTGAASYGRLAAFCSGTLAGMADLLARGAPLVLVGEGDVGGLVGMHVSETARGVGILSIDGVVLADFDFIDIGAMLENSGAVPVVIKSLVFPGAGLGAAR